MRKLKVILVTLVVMTLCLSIGTTDVSAASLRVSSFSVSGGSSPKVGTTVTLKANAKGGSGTKRYQFRYRYNGKMYTIKNYSTSKSTKFKISKAGTYKFYVYVKDRRSTKSRTKTVKATQALSASLSTSNAYTKERMTLTASSSGGSGSKKYKFTYKINNGKTKTIRNYSSSRSVSFTPGGTGRYTFYVTVRDGKKKTKTVSKVINMNYRPLSNSLSLSTSTVASGKSITIKNSGSGGYGTKRHTLSYTYNGVETVLLNNSTATSRSFTPTQTGTYTFKLVTRDSTNRTITKTQTLNVFYLRVNMSTTSLTVGTTQSISHDYTSGASLSYKSSNQAVCMVDSKYGFLMPIGAGTATITVTANVNGSSTSQSFNVSVRDNSNVLVGCDISKWQGTINASRLKATGIDYTILRAGHGVPTASDAKTDTRFAYNVSQCKSAGLPYGIYWYSEALSEEDAVKEADGLVNFINASGSSVGSSYFDFPIYYDLEYGSQGSLGSTRIEAIVRAFVARLNAHGIPTSKISIYANKSWYEGKLDRSYYNNTFGDRLWYARYNYPGGNPTFYWNCISAYKRGQMWQVGSSFRNVSGVSSTNLDMDYYYK